MDIRNSIFNKKNYLFTCPHCIGVTISKEPVCYVCEWCYYKCEDKRGLHDWLNPPNDWINPQFLANRIESNNVKNK